MDGFGAAITGSAAYNLLQMQPADRDSFLRQTFSPEEGFGWSYVRIAIGCSDFSLSEYTCCDEEGIENFALTAEETEYVIPVLKEILAINPDLKIIGSPWTCPIWMKVKSLDDPQPFPSWTSGQLNPKYYSDYAEYFVRWVNEFHRNGINVYAVTPQNEPLNRGNSASLFMGWEEQRNFVGNALLPAFKKSLPETKIYLFDHNYNYDRMPDQQQYPLKIYEAGINDPLIAGAAYHNYGGRKEELLNIHNAMPDKELIFTETSIGTWNDGRDLSFRLSEDMREIGLGTINNWCKAVIVWNLMLDSDRGPFRPGGCGTCYGAVDIDRSDYRTITRNSHYYVISHLASVVRPGAVRIGTVGYSTEGLEYSAFENTDGSLAFVALNSTDAEQTFTVACNGVGFQCSIPARSVISCLM
jgi:glucosylceramidase